MRSIQAFHYRYETSDVRTRVTTLYNEQLVVQENVAQAIDQLKNSLDEGMRLQLDTAIERYGYERIINGVPEDSAMHAICRLHIVDRRLDIASEELANEIQYRLGFEDEEDSDVVMDGESQELVGAVC